MPRAEAFVRLGWSMHVDHAAIPVLHMVPAGQARKEMIDLGYIDANQAMSDSVVKGDPREPGEPQLRRRGDR